MKDKLVSIITPCYNTGAILHRLLDSVLMQDYPYVEMFCIDDGSKDNTRYVVESYISKFGEKGYNLSYIYQENAGQSYAINRALKLVTGKYLLWPDSDDYYNSSAFISKLVTKFEELPQDYGLVRSALQFVDEDTLETLSTSGLDAPDYKNFELFEDCLFSRNGFYFPPIAYMVRIDYLKEVTGLEIFCAKNTGQNWQIMLPILARYKSYTIKEILCNVLARSNSHSRGQYGDIDGIIKRYHSYEDTLVSIINSINGLESRKKEFYISEIRNLLVTDLFNVILVRKSSEHIRRLYKRLCDLGNAKITHHIIYIITFIPYGLTVYLKLHKLLTN